MALNLRLPKVIFFHLRPKVTPSVLPKAEGTKAIRPTMRPQACMIIIYVTFWVFHGWLIISQRFWLAGVEIREEMRDLLLFWQKRDWPMDGRTDRRTDPVIEMRGHI